MAQVTIHNKTSQSLKIAVLAQGAQRPHAVVIAARGKIGPINRATLTQYTENLCAQGHLRIVKS